MCQQKNSAITAIKSLSILINYMISITDSEKKEIHSNLMLLKNIYSEDI